MQCSEYNERFEIVEKSNQKGMYRIYDFKAEKHIGILFDRVSDAEKWLESKGFKKAEN